MTQESRRTQAQGRTVATVDGLGHAFGDVTVFRDVSFEVSEGTMTTLVGPNGSGKTTLLRIVAGLLSPTDGTVEVTSRSGRAVGYLPQQPSFRPVFTVEETLRFYADLLPTDVDVAAAIERVGLAGARDRNVDALSGGMRRLLGIAQATLGDPSLVLLDEPTGDLDPRMTEYVFEVLVDLAESGMAIVLATHNLLGAENADDVVLLDRGRIVVSGPPDEFVAEADADSLAEAFRHYVSGDTDLTVRSGTAGGEGQ
ncbi:MAG: ABC transporter ATP-binding protein [Haloferacaceae archaeon]